MEAAFGKEAKVVAAVLGPHGSVVKHVEDVVANLSMNQLKAFFNKAEKDVETIVLTWSKAKMQGCAFRFIT